MKIRKNTYFILKNTKLRKIHILACIFTFIGKNQVEKEVIHLPISPRNEHPQCEDSQKRSSHHAENTESCLNTHRVRNQYKTTAINTIYIDQYIIHKIPIQKQYRHKKKNQYS